jgi:hypothetical protein
MTQNGPEFYYEYATVYCGIITLSYKESVSVDHCREFP